MALHSLATDIRAALGCLSCSVSADMANRGVVRYLEEWQTEEDLRRRLRSDAFAHVLTLMEDAIQPPQIEFALGRGTRGFDFVEEVRGAQVHE
jgi:quinol monooxygenase YgiN